MVGIDWLHVILAAAAVIAPAIYNRVTGGNATDAAAKFPILSFLVKVLSQRANLTPEENSAVSQALGETHPGIPPVLLALSNKPAPAPAASTPTP
jgi:hypothetical protein